jgi:MFS family permease
MNIQAVIVERVSERSMMSGFHGLFSVGGIAGAACMTMFLGTGWSPFAATLWIAGGIVVALALAVRNLLPYGTKSQGPAFAIPHGVVLVIGVLCFVAFLTEGAVLDWSAIFLTSVRGMAAENAGLGYAVFSLAMTAGRLTGDAVVRRTGGANVILFGGGCAALGLAVATLVPMWQSTLFGYALVGIGCANIVPVLYTSAGRQSVMPEYLAIPAITTLGYAGILIGPAAIGFVAHASSLPVAFMILALLQLCVALGGRLVSARQSMIASG